MLDYLRGCESEYLVMVTLTWPSSASPAPEEAERCRRAFCKRLLRSQPSGFSFFWFREFTTRGTCHFHGYANRYIPRRWLASAWAETCKTGDQNHLAAGTRVEALRRGRAGICKYAAKYASKQAQKTLPEGISGCGRWWGISGSRRVVAAATGPLGALEAWSNRQLEGMNLLESELDSMISAGKAKTWPWDLSIWGLQGWIIPDIAHQRRIRSAIEALADGPPTWAHMFHASSAYQAA